MNDVEKYEAIDALFDKAIRPALQGDGGDLELDFFPPFFFKVLFFGIKEIAGFLGFFDSFHFSRVSSFLFGLNS